MLAPQIIPLLISCVAALVFLPWIGHGMWKIRRQNIIARERAAWIAYVGRVAFKGMCTQQNDELAIEVGEAPPCTLFTPPSMDNIFWGRKWGTQPDPMIDELWAALSAAACENRDVIEARKQQTPEQNVIIQS